MSIKKEVEQLTNVYSNLLNEQLDAGGINIGYGGSVPGMVTNSDESPNMDDTPEFASSENSENHLFSQPVGKDVDTNLSMAKSEIFKILKSAGDLMDLIKCPETDIEPWQLSKITKAADYICSVKSAIEYDEFERMSGEMSSGLSEMGGMSPVVVKVKDMLAGEPMEVNEEVIKQAIFNIECLKEAKKIKEEKPKTCNGAKKGCACSRCPQCRANKKKKK